MKKVIEALLFAKTRGVEIKEIKALTGLNKSKVIGFLEELKKEYEGRGVVVTSEDDKWKMMIKPELIDSVKDSVQIEMQDSLLKTLSVIAWKSPIKQSIVTKIRGNKAYSHIGKLIRQGFIMSRREGRTLLLSTTPKFTDYFKLKKNNVLTDIKDKEAKTKVVVQETIYKGK